MGTNTYLEKKAVLVRTYTDPTGRIVSYPQCKVFNINGDLVAFRDIHGWKSQLFRDNSWNIDHLVFEWLKDNKVKKIYYYEHKTKNLFKISLLTLSNALKRGDAYRETLNNHTQIFVPHYLWTCNPPEGKEILANSKKWIKKIINVG